MGLNFKILVVALTTLGAGLVALSPSVAYAADQKVRPLKLSLAEALTLSSQRNQEIAVYRNQLEEGREERSEAVSKFLPSITAKISAGTKHDKDPALDDPQPEIARDYNHYLAGIYLRQPLFVGGANLAAYRTAQAAVDVSDIELHAKQQELRKQVVEGYFQLQLLLAKIAAEEEIRSVRSKQLTYSKARFRSGTVTQVDVLRAEYELERQKPEIESLKNDFEKSKLEFAHIVGLPLDQSFELSMTLAQAYDAMNKVKFPSLPEALAQALELNPTLRKLRAEIHHTNQQAAVSRAAHFPKVDLVLQAETNANKREQIGSPETQRYAGMVEVSVPLFTGLSSLSERRQVASREAALEASFEVEKQKLLRDLNGALKDIELSRFKAVSGDANIKLAKQTVEQSMAQYRSGKVNLTTVLDSYTQQLEARNDHSQALYDGVVAVAQTQWLIGVRVLDKAVSNNAVQQE